MGFKKFRFGIGGGNGGRRVLAYDEVAVHLGEWPPIRPFRVEATESLQFVIDQERDDIGETSTSIVKIPSVFRADWAELDDSQVRSGKKGPK